MCATCGCSDPDNQYQILLPGQDKLELKLAPNSHDNEHNHHHHAHNHHHQHVQTVSLEMDVLSRNNLLAERNRGFFEAKNIKAFNLVSSPGSGKTALLEKTLTELSRQLQFYVIEGDQQTTRDADRIHQTGAAVVQVNTGSGCHLDAKMVNEAVKKLNPENDSYLMIENVGNLVCPSMFDLGESKRVVMISITEGDDKPLKYPNMFESSHLCLINKIDLQPYINADLELIKNYALRINHHLEFIELSVQTGQGMDLWYQWLHHN